jgi:hypothetical protein
MPLQAQKHIVSSLKSVWPELSIVAEEVYDIMYTKKEACPTKTDYVHGQCDSAS